MTNSFVGILSEEIKGILFRASFVVETLGRDSIWVLTYSVE